MSLLNKRHGMTALSLTVFLALTGCKTTEPPLVGSAVDSLMGKRAATEERLSTAAANAIIAGKTAEALALYEKLYAHDNTGFSSPDVDHQDVALNYAQLLRKTGKAQRAITILTPFVEIQRGETRRTDKKRGEMKDKIDPIILNEYAASSIELGNFAKAETLLTRVLEDKNASKFHADAYNLLGIALDAQGQHREAEQSFRQSLDGWKGDATSVMNNLAVCLASQGMFDESLTTLRQALVMAPDKQEIAHNIQMVSDLRQSLIPTPRDIKKKK